MRAPPSCDFQRTKLNNPASFLSIDARMDQFKQVGVQPLAAQTDVERDGVSFVELVQTDKR
jgi:hypothetical protein